MDFIANRTEFRIYLQKEKLYEGKYGPRTITFENDELYYQRTGRPKYRMILLSDELFMLKEIDYFRIKIIKEVRNSHYYLSFFFHNTVDDIPQLY